MAGDTEQLVFRAKTDDNSLTDLVETHRQWILRVATDAAGHYITDSDDEWSVALLAFSEAVNSFDADRGAFQAFAKTVIKRRLVDYYRSQGKYRAELTVLPGAFEGELEEDEVTGATLAVERQVAAQSREDLSARAREEIQEVKELLAGYGFDYFALAQDSPKAEKTRLHCARAVQALLEDASLRESTRSRKKLPMGELARRCGVPKKILDRHRKYLIAAMEILDGDFPIMSGYLEHLRRRQP